MFSNTQDIMVYIGITAIGALMFFVINWYCTRELESKCWIIDNISAIRHQLAAFDIRIEISRHADWCVMVMPRCDQATKNLSFHKAEKILRMMETERPDHVFYRYAKDIKLTKPGKPGKSSPNIGASHGKD